MAWFHRHSTRTLSDHSWDMGQYLAPSFRSVLFAVEVAAAQPHWEDSAFLRRGGADVYITTGRNMSVGVFFFFFFLPLLVGR